MAENSDAKMFTCFSKLPLEIRLMIWQAALPTEGRIVTISDKGKNYRYPRERDPVTQKIIRRKRLVYVHRAVASTKIPDILVVNQESRGVALKYYPLSFGELLGGKAVHFNVEKDTLLLKNSAARDAFFNPNLRYGQTSTETQRRCQQQVLDSLQRLALGEKSFRGRFPTVIYPGPETIGTKLARFNLQLKQFRSLKALVYMAKSTDYFNSSRYSAYRGNLENLLGLDDRRGGKDGGNNVSKVPELVIINTRMWAASVTHDK